ncbi:hypothetical protein ABZ863_12130 [Saccharomonospora sp. NPDC046836]|uniref:hypothetical protein n=1 Tax=Saccharomonospora sp. NPDC046836 TaxID=3156921 RepID=UPI0033E4929F
MANGDGTQAPEPSQTFGDPLSGLVTSGQPDFPSAPERYDFGAVEIAKPVEADPDMVRGMVDAALGGDERQPDAPAQADPSAEPAVPAAREPEPDGAEVPAQRGWTAPARLLPQMLRRRSTPREPQPEQQLLRKPTRGSAGVIVALVLMAVFGIVAIQFVTSFIESITGLFD